MENYGNTCYCNAVLQCLKKCPPTLPEVNNSLLGPLEHREFVYNLSSLGDFGRFACDASEFLLKIVDGIDIYTGEFRTKLTCSACKKVDNRVEKTTIIPVCANDNLASLLTSHSPGVQYVCDCGKPFRALTTFYSGNCLVLHFVCRVTLEWVKSLQIAKMKLVALVFYTGAHYTAYCQTDQGWRTFDDDLIYVSPPKARPYLAFFVSINAQHS